MRVTVCFGQTRVIVPCKGGATVAELVKEACARYKKAIGKNPKYWVKIRQLENAIDGGILDADDYVYDVAEDRDQLIAIFEEEDDHTYHYNGWDRRSGSGSEGHRSPLSFQHQQVLNNRLSNEKPAGNRERSHPPAGNATVIKHVKRERDLEVNVGVEALKSSSNSNITVRRENNLMVNEGENDDVDGKIWNPMKKNPAIPQQYYSRRQSGSGQEEDIIHPSDLANRHQEIMITTANSSPDRNLSVVTANSDTNVSIDSGHHSVKAKYGPESSKNYSNFVRGSTRQSIMGMLSENYDEENYEKTRQPPDGRKQNSTTLDDFTGFYQARYDIERYLPPPPKDPSVYPRFYSDSQEMFVDIDNRPLGIKVTCYKDRKIFCGMLVESIDEGGRSDREGLLQEGDIIVEINNYILSQYSVSVAQEIFQNAMKFPELQLRVYPVEERERASTGNTIVDNNNALNRHRHTPSIPVLSLVEATPPKASKISAAKSLPDLNASSTSKFAQDVSPNGKFPLVARMSLDTLSNNTRKLGNMFEIELRKGEQGLGFSITTRDTPVGDPGPIYIKNILPKGAAIQDGRLHAGDRLLKVNDVEMTGHTQESAVNILRCIEVGSVVRMVVSRHVGTLPRKLKDDPAADKALSDDSNKEFFKFEIALNDTGSAGLGISLKGNQSKKTKRDLGIFVKSVFHGGAAYQDGRLQPNDQLVSVNGQSLSAMTNHEAIDTLRTSMSTVGNVRGMIQMVIARRKPNPGDPTSPQFSSEASSEMSDSLINSRSSFEITGNSREENLVDDSFCYQEEIPHQIDPIPPDAFGVGTYNDSMASHQDEDCTPSPDPQDPEIDPFSRESVFRHSISEKRRGPASRDAQSTEAFKVSKSKQLNSTELEKKPTTPEIKNSTTVTSLKWVKPSNSKTYHSTNSPRSDKTPISPARQSPGIARRNLNNCNNLPVMKEELSIQPEVEVGPMLGIAKSSSLESLQTAVENYVDSQDGAFPKAQQRVLRGRVLNESFRAALDQSYDMENLSGKPMATLKEEGSNVSPLVKSAGSTPTSGQRTNENKRARKSTKFFGLFRVGKNKRSLSSDRNLDSLSSTSSSPRVPESEVHKRLLEAKREDDFRKHQAETERIQAKAKAMREQQEHRRKNEGVTKSRQNLTKSKNDERVRAPSVPVTAMQRINIDAKVSHSEAPSGRHSVDMAAMRNSQPQTFEWHSAKRPTLPVDYGEHHTHRRTENKSSLNKMKINPDYSSLPRQPRFESHAGEVSVNSDGVVTHPEGPVTASRSPNKETHVQNRSGTNGNHFNNYEFYNMQKPPASKRQSKESKTQKKPIQRESDSVTERHGRSERPKVGRTLYYDDLLDSTSTSKSDEYGSPQRPNISSKSKSRQATTINGFELSSMGNSFHREESPEPPPVTYRKSRQTAATNNYRHTVHVDAPNSRHYERNSGGPSFKWKPHLQHINHDQSDSDSYRTASPASSGAAERNRDAVKKLLKQTRYGERHGKESIVISPPYNL